MIIMIARDKTVKPTKLPAAVFHKVLSKVSTGSCYLPPKARKAPDPPLNATVPTKDAWDSPVSMILMSVLIIICSTNIGAWMIITPSLQ
jgi:hypothetical protein